MLQAQFRDETFATKLKALRVWLKPKPYTGHLGRDCFYLLLVAITQLAIAPAFLPGAMAIDLLTPWLIIGFVRGNLLRIYVMGGLAALFIETYSAVPSGFYFCCYFMIGTILYLIRPSLSWRLTLPWFASFAISELAIIGFESFVIYLMGLGDILTPLYGLLKGAKVVLAIAFGMMLVDKHWVRATEGEEST